MTAPPSARSLSLGIPNSGVPIAEAAGLGYPVYVTQAWRYFFGSISGAAPLEVASLPAASVAGNGFRMFVTDANATTFNSIVAGGGANNVPVFSDGTNWRIG